MYAVAAQCIDSQGGIFGVRYSPQSFSAHMYILRIVKDDFGGIWAIQCQHNGSVVGNSFFWARR